MLEETDVYVDIFYIQTLIIKLGTFIYNATCIAFVSLDWCSSYFSLSGSGYYTLNMQSIFTGPKYLF